jgi:membrane protease YdiL (CAAX protease family)
MTVVDLAYLPHWPKSLLDTAKNTSLRENFYACFYGGFNEEYLTRLFGISLIAWLLSHIGRYTGSTPAAWVMWTAILIMAILFAAGHLPALKGVSGTVSGVMLKRTFVLNALLAIICGWFYWKYGIEAAVITHFAADLVYHVGGTAVLHNKLCSTKTC